jgi:hypothetical protein
MKNVETKRFEFSELDIADIVRSLNIAEHDERVSMAMAERLAELQKRLSR